MSVSESAGIPAEVSPVRDGVIIDSGMRHWYHSCPCCLRAAHPEVKRILDGEGRAEPGDGGDGPGRSG